MPNCDWGKPCDCKVCRTEYETIKCPKCDFNNVVEILQDAKLETDRKGIRYYEFTTPIGPSMDLMCYKCGHLIKNTGYYSSISTSSCKRNLDRDRALEEGKCCLKCNAVEDFDYIGMEKVALRNKDGKLYCQDCLIEIIKLEIPDPSNQNERYVFNRENLKWDLSRIKKPCIECGKARWLNADNLWKTRCAKCFKKSIR